VLTRGNNNKRLERADCFTFFFPPRTARHCISVVFSQIWWIFSSFWRCRGNTERSNCWASTALSIYFRGNHKFRNFCVWGVPPFFLFLWR
jgi:hypothetical protein